MKQIKIKIVTSSPRSKQVVNNVIKRLDANKHQVSVESQQLTSVGMMPDPNYQVIDVTKMSIAQAIRVYEQAKDKVGQGSKYVLIKDEEHEFVEDRIDREALGASLKNLGYEVLSTDVEMTDDIQTKYNDLSINVTGAENV